MELRTTRLHNGIRLTTDTMKDVQTISIGIWVGIGSRHESLENNGISHFLEHMMFKGTKTRSAYDIVNEIESVGGIMNAHTSREVTAYYIKILKKDLELAVDILADILQNSQFDPQEVEREREVILQEISQSYDTPDDIIFDYFQEIAFKNQAIGRSILGPKENIQKFQNIDFENYINSQYRSNNIVFCAAGNLDHDRLATLLESKITKKILNGAVKKEMGSYTGGERIISKDIEQTHLLIGYEGLSLYDPLYYAQSVFATLFGGGMSSRLFQEIREKRGLAYSTFCYSSSYQDTGLFAMYGATSHDKIKELKTVLVSELEKTLSTLKIDEIEKAKQQLIASKSMALESTNARCEHCGYDTLFFGVVKPIEEMIRAIENVSQKDIESLVTHYLNSKQSYTLLGKID